MIVTLRPISSILADIDNNEATIALSGLLHDDDASIRSEGIHALADIGGDMAGHYLQQALADATRLIAKWLLDTLLNLPTRSWRVDSDQRVVPAPPDLSGGAHDEQ